MFKRNLDFSDIEFIRKESGLPVIVKGILTPQNTNECAEYLENLKSWNASLPTTL